MNSKGIENITIDKELRDLLPRLTSEEYRYLEKAIIEEGCREPLAVWDDHGQMTLLGGHNRFAICMEHKIDFKVILVKSVKSRHDARIWMLRDQLGRRNLNDFVRARFVLQFEYLVREQAKKNQLSGLKQNLKSAEQNSAERIDTREVLSDFAGISHDTMSKVKFINQKGSKDQIRRLENGESSINSVYADLKKKTGPQNPSKEKEIERLINKFIWSVQREAIPIGNKFLEHKDELRSDQKAVIIRTLLGLLEFLNMMVEILQREDIKKEAKES